VAAALATAPAVINAAPIVDASGSLVKSQAGTAKPDKVGSKIDEVISNKLSELDIDAFKDTSGTPDNRKGKHAGPASPSPAPPNPTLEVAEVPEKLENAGSAFCLFCDLF
jgi:phage tail tape-measure protein